MSAPYEMHRPVSHMHVAALQLRPELVEEAGLPEAGLARDEGEPAVSGAGVVERGHQDPHLFVAAEERGEAPFDRDVDARARAARPLDLEDLQRVRLALHLEAPEVAEDEVALRQTLRALARDDGSGSGERLHPRGGVDRVAHGLERELEIGPDVAEDDRTAVQSDADPEVDAAFRELRPVVVQRVLDREAGPDGALRMILVRDRGAEEHEHPVAEELADRALVAMDLVEHEANARCIRARVSSGSSRSERLVYPATSAKSTVICLRSPSMPGVSVRIFVASDGGVYVWRFDRLASSADVASAAPHSRQKLPSDGLRWPQRGQVAEMAAPHVPQNFASAGFDAPHAETGRGAGHGPGG